VCYSYRDRQAQEEARRMMRDREDRKRREERANKDEKGSAPEKERELVRA
jgi:hypothetical protein